MAVLWQQLCVSACVLQAWPQRSAASHRKQSSRALCKKKIAMRSLPPEHILQGPTNSHNCLCLKYVRVISNQFPRSSFCADGKVIKYTFLRLILLDLSLLQQCRPATFYSNIPENVTVVRFCPGSFTFQTRSSSTASC